MKKDPVTVLVGDCLESLRGMPDGAVDCCVTSPPYWGLRDYGTGKWEGGVADCDHVRRRIADGMDGTTQNSCRQGRTPPADIKYTGVCEKCGATRVDEQIGLEETPEAYVAKLVDVFREVRRVLRDDGTLWLNLGDSYAATPCGSFNGGGFTDGSIGRDMSGVATSGRKNKLAGSGLKPKDLVGIPWRVAFALQADGWWLRQDIIWHKPNPMPESVTDRCTKAHEYVFLLSKSEQYRYDADAIKEHAVGGARTRNLASNFKKAGSHSHGKHTSGGAPEIVCDGSRNKRSVWTVASQPYAEAHFATFPPKLIEPCILAGCPVGGTVLDTFGGSGTTALVAIEHHRNAVLCELNPQYAKLIERRVRSAQPRLFS